MNKQTVLITGAAGFIGSHLCDKFLSEGFKVIGVDNFSTGRDENISHLFTNPDFEFHNYDITNYFFIEGDIDYILHFASAASPLDYMRMPIQTMMVGSKGTHNCLGLAKKKNARVLVASTSEVYGDPTVSPQSEEYWGNVNPVGERAVYDEAKRFLEALTTAYQYHIGVDTRIVRIFNTFGERMRPNDGRAIPAFFSQAIRGEDITMFGTGYQSRSFGYISDTVEGIYKLLLSNYTKPVNIGNPQEINLHQLAAEIIEITGSKSKIIHKPLPSDDPKQRCPDITVAKTVLQWEPKVDRVEGLKRTYEYFKKILANEK